MRHDACPSHLTVVGEKGKGGVKRWPQLLPARYSSPRSSSETLDSLRWASRSTVLCVVDDEGVAVELGQPRRSRPG